MIDADKIDLVHRVDGGFTLTIRDRMFDLSPSGFAKLCRIGNSFKHLVKKDVDSGPPYVVHVAIPYLDFGGDQDTQSYNCPVCLNTREEAELIIPALRAELEVMGFTPDGGYRGQHEVSVELLAVPEDRFYLKDMECSEDIADALVDFRYDIVQYSDHHPSAEWWESFGLEEGDMTADREQFIHNN